MNYHKLTTNPDSTSVEHVESPTMVKENNVPEDLELSDIKTLYGELIYSWPVEPEVITGSLLGVIETGSKL